MLAPIGREEVENDPSFGAWKHLEKLAWRDVLIIVVILLLPGIDYTVAQTCLAAIGNISRFANA